MADITKACRSIESFLPERAQQDLAADEMFLSALLYQIQIIGEASNHVSAALKYPSLPWKRMIGMRQHIAHGYFSLDMQILWKACTEAVPALRKQVEEVIVREWPE